MRISGYFSLCSLWPLWLRKLSEKPCFHWLKLTFLFLYRFQRFLYVSRYGLSFCIDAFAAATPFAGLSFQKANTQSSIRKISTGSVNTNGIAQITATRPVKFHQNYVPDDMFVDHINRIRNDNRRANLRPATQQQNIWNTKQKRKKSNTPYTGIHWNKNRQKWQVQLTVNGKQRGFGYFTDEIEAAKEYDKAAKKYRGQFAILNFPD